MSPDPRWPAAARRARDLVMAHGWNATAYQLVNPGIAHWFASEGDAVVGYVRAAGVRVVAGAPVCAPARLADVAAAFERDAAAAGDGVCYFGAEARLDALYRDSPAHARALLGAQPAWDPARWADAVAGHASLRAQLNRARNKGVRVAEWGARAAGESAALRRVLAAWLGTRGLPPLHFLVEPATLDRLDDRRVLVATRGDGAEESVVAFTVLSPIPARGGWLVEQFPRAPGAPNGTVELLLDAAVRAVAADGARYVTLGLAPLAGAAAGADTPRADDPLWLRLAFRWVRAHGRRFYNFAGLEAFKAKFRPERWEPVYAIARGGREHFSPRALYAIAAAFGGRSPVTLVSAALARALSDELRWAGAELRRVLRGRAGGG